MALTTSSPNTTIATVGVLALLVGGGFVYMVQSKKLAEAVQASARLDSETTSKATDIQLLSNADAQLTEKEAALSLQGVTPQTLSATVPETEDIPGLYLQMETLVQKSTAVSAVAYQLGTPVSQTDKTVAVPVTVTASGSYGDIKGFITSLETAVRPLSFSTVSLTQAAGTAQSDKYLFSGTASVKGKSLSSAYEPVTKQQL